MAKAVATAMAVIMAAMSGIIGGEVVLLGLIALPQMLKLGYNQNLAIGTICASGSLGTIQVSPAYMALVVLILALNPDSVSSGGVAPAAWQVVQALSTCSEMSHSVGFSIVSVPVVWPSECPCGPKGLSSHAVESSMPTAIAETKTFDNFTVHLLKKK